MSREVIKIEGTVVEALPNTVFRVELPNGHRVLAHVEGKGRREPVQLAPGEKVMLGMTPYDFSKGCILAREI